jgi:hypothetical protein
MKVTVIGLKGDVCKRLQKACPGVRLKTLGPAAKPQQLSGEGHVVLAIRFVSHGLCQAVAAKYPADRIHRHTGCMTGLPELVRLLAQDTKH